MLIANLSAVTTFDTRLEPGSLPSAGITRLRRYYGPIRHPTRPHLSLTGCELTASAVTLWGFPCCSDLPLAACRHQYPGRTRKRHRRSPVSLAAAYPYGMKGSAPATPVFGACSVFTHVTAR